MAARRTRATSGVPTLRRRPVAARQLAVAGAADARCVLPARRLDQVHRQREHDRRVLVDADLVQRLQVAQLERRGVCGDHVGGLG